MRRDFGLHDDFFAGQSRENVAKLHFRSAVAARRFNVIDAEFQCAMNCGFEVLLVFGGNFLWVNVLPFELVPHSTAGKNGHGDFSATKATILHAPNL